MNQQNKIIITIILTAFIIGGLILLSILIQQPKSQLSITGKVIKTIEPTDPFTENTFVTKIIDGDTVVINGESVRLLGIDCDERGYPCYKQAKQRIEELILNKEVELETDGEDKDQYRRYLRYIFLNGKNINLQLVEEGLAVARFSPQNIKYKTEILFAEKQAREDEVGCKWKEDEEKEEDEEEETEEDTNEEDKNEEQEGEIILEGNTCVSLGCPKGTMYVGSLKSNKYHECSCTWAKKIYTENLNCFTSRKDAENQNYVACKVCKP